MQSAYSPDVLSGVLPAIAQANPTLLSSGSFYLAETAGALIGCGGWTPQRPGEQFISSAIAKPKRPVSRHSSATPA
ncbi:MAG: hypothetical protein WBC73_12660 [Phormidesmis sp.]